MRSLIEVAVVFAATMAYIWWVRLWHPWAWIVVLGFIIGTHFTHEEGVGWLGFSWKALRVAFRPVFPWTLGISAAALIMGVVAGTIREVRLEQAAASVAAYILWGLFQQYILNGYFVNRLQESVGKKHPGAACLTAAVLFSLVHLPNWYLMAVTLVGGYVCTRVYLRYRSLYILALAHGIIGFCLFLVTPDAISGHFLVGPRYLLNMYQTYPEFLL